MRHAYRKSFTLTKLVYIEINDVNEMLQKEAQTNKQKTSQAQFCTDTSCTTCEFYNTVRHNNNNNNLV